MTASIRQPTRATVIDRQLQVPAMALPEPVDPIEAYLDQAASVIVGRGRQIVVDIIAIGRQLVEVKQRIAHGRYEAFVRDRLGFSVSSALRFVRAYQMLESAKLTDLDCSR
jgi:Protein of unknown function (DUF3102)